MLRFGVPGDGFLKLSSLLPIELGLEWALFELTGVGVTFGSDDANGSFLREGLVELFESTSTSSELGTKSGEIDAKGG